MVPTFSPKNRLKLSFDAIFLYVTDVEDSIAFYRDTLGLPMISQDYVVRFDLDGVLVELVPLPPGSVVPGSGNARLCFAVSDLKETVEQLHARGVATSDIKNKKGGKIVFFRDPDRNELSIWEGDRIDNAKETIRCAELHA